MVNMTVLVSHYCNTNLFIFNSKTFLGFRARYCHYVVMDLDTGHVLSFYTAIKHQVRIVPKIVMINLFSKGHRWLSKHGAIRC